jgi:hypothetical protein
LEDPVCKFHWHGIPKLKKVRLGVQQLAGQDCKTEKQIWNMIRRQPAGCQTSKAEGAAFQWKDDALSV